MRISKKTRETAALICAISASTPDLREDYLLVRQYLGCAGTEQAHALDLALAAWQFVVDGVYAQRVLPSANIDAEAEALLRDGWSPS